VANRRGDAFLQRRFGEPRNAIDVFGMNHHHGAVDAGQCEQFNYLTVVQLVARPRPPNRLWLRPTIRLPCPMPSTWRPKRCSNRHLGTTRSTPPTNT
jgi:hypothetical protein